MLVAPTVERAAVLGTAFDEVVAATLGELGAVLATDGHDIPCVAITGVPTRGGRLASVISAVLDACAPDVQLILDLGGPVGADLSGGGSEALRGLALVDRLDLAGVPCLRFQPAKDRDSVPDLAPVRAGLGGALDASTRLAVEVRALLGPGENARLLARIAELETALAAATTSPGRAGAGAAASTRGPAAGVLNRLRAHDALLALGLVLVAAVAVVTAMITSGGGQDAALTALLGLGLVHLAYAWRCDRRARLTNLRLVEQVRESLAQARRDSAAAREQERTAAELAARVARMEQNLAIVTAATVDTAHAVAKLRGQNSP